MGIIECLIYGLVAGAGSLLMGMSLVNTGLIVIITTGVLLAMELPFKKIIRTSLIVLVIFGLVKVVGPKQISLNLTSSHSVAVVHNNSYDTATETEKQLDPIVEELGQVVSSHGFSSFLCNGRKVTRNGKKYWRFASGKEVEISKVGENVLLFESIKREKRGLFHKEIYMVAEGHNVQATWQPGHPEKGKLVVVSPTIWIKKLTN